MNEKLEKALKEAERQLKVWNVPSAVITVVKGDEVLFSGGIGSRDNAELPADRKTLVQIASCTKAFTATALAVLATEGKFDFDKPLTEYIPDFRLNDSYATENLTIRDYLSHRSGLPRHEYAWYDTGFSRKELIHNLRYLPLNAPIRYRYQYSNFNYMIAGAAIEAVSGMPFEKFLKERVLESLGMTDMGGGGKGMRTAFSPEEFENAFLTAQKEAMSAFGDGNMYLEHFVEHPRHIEVQILADNEGNVIHLGERDCSVQRKHQKLIEESPSAGVSDELRKKMGDVAVRAAKAAKYVSAGTIEFLLEADERFYFMEMNTRIQVEHPVTEWVTGIDLIKEQIKIASGESLKIRQEDVKIQGHAIECRINAENPYKNFRPSPGRISTLHLPGGQGIRVDTGIYSGYEIPPYYDSMLAKLIVHAEDRPHAIAKMLSAMGEVIIGGIDTNVDYQFEILSDPDYQEGNINIDFLKDHEIGGVKIEE